jgi:hypothetical protein
MRDDILYAGELGPRVKNVTALSNFRLLIFWDNGEERIFDAKGLLQMRVFAPLRDEDFFKAVEVRHGSILWPNDIDYCPDTLYLESRAKIGEEEYVAG